MARQVFGYVKRTLVFFKWLLLSTSVQVAREIGFFSRVLSLLPFNPGRSDLLDKAIDSREIPVIILQEHISSYAPDR
jgi:hypothetical protein